MKVIVLGTGSIALTLTESLVAEKFDVTVVDSNKESLTELSNQYDVQTVHGVGSHPDVLRRAGADDCDLMIAVSDNDEVNMLACQVTFSLFRVPLRLARIRNSAYLQNRRLFDEDHLPINVVINPENVVTDQISHLIKHPGANQVMSFGEDRVQLLELSIRKSEMLEGLTIKELPTKLPKVDTRVVAVYRNDRQVELDDEFILQAGDDICLVVATAHADLVLKSITRLSSPCRRIMIAGGGNIGEHLALNLEKDYLVKVIEPNLERCNQLAESVNKAVILHGSATNSVLLHDEQIEAVDVFCALTNNDEINIMSSLLARQKGAKKTVTLVNKSEYFEMLLHNPVIDIVLSPRKTTIGMLLSHIRRGSVVRVYSLRCSGEAEVLEVVAYDDQGSSEVVGCTVKEVAWPKGTRVCALVRDKQVIIKLEDQVIQAGDHLVLLISDKKQAHLLERFFQVSALSF